MPRDPHPLGVLMVLEAVYPAPNGGGAEAQVRTLARGMRARGHRVTIVTPMALAGMPRVDRVDGSAVVRLRYPRIRLLGGPWLWLEMFWFLLSRRRRYDVWHIHIAHHLGAVTALVGSWLDKRVVTKVSGWWELERGVFAPRAGPLSALARHCLLRSGYWQAISHRIASGLRERGVPRDRIAAIPNAVDMSRFSGMPRPRGDDPHFIYIGRLVAEKGLEDLLHAFAGISGRFPRARLTLVGDGTLHEPLQKLAASLGIAGKVQFAGHRDDIEAPMAQANIGVLPSRIEGLSNTLLECMAAGMPMVASRISGNEDFVRTNENGWLFESGDRMQLAQCLQAAALLDKPARDAMGDRARATVGQQAGLDGVLDKLFRLYRATHATPAADVAPDGRLAGKDR